MKKKTGWGILGPGAIANEFAQCLALLDDAYIAAVGSRSLERSRAFCAVYGGKAYDSYEEMCADPNVDIVYVATPHPFHEPHVIMACNAGKHVLCEKPFAVNNAQALRMVETARKNHVFLQEGLWSRFFPAWQYVKKKIDSGCFGALRQIRCATGWGLTDAFTHLNPRLMTPELAGGAMLDACPYSLAAMTFARGKLDEPVYLSSYMQFEKQAPVDSDEDIMMVFEDGFSAHLQASLRRNDQQCELVCENATMILPINRNPSRVFIRENPPVWAYLPQGQEPNNEQKEVREAWNTSLPAGRTVVTSLRGEDIVAMDFPFEAQGFQFEASSVQQCVREGLTENPQAPLAETLLISRLSDEVRRQCGLRFPFE